ncbi:hypothetical protein EON62_02180 [archaeon]|nr:MAG: hypothetical protein EON62_02180 [archaeon]
MKGQVPVACVVLKDGAKGTREQVCADCCAPHDHHANVKKLSVCVLHGVCPACAHVQIMSEIVARVREEVGPVAAFKTAVIVPRLPKTRSGKVLRAVMKCIADATPYKFPATIDDPAVLGEIESSLKSAGYCVPPAHPL